MITITFPDNPEIRKVMGLLEDQGFDMDSAVLLGMSALGVFLEEGDVEDLKVSAKNIERSLTELREEKDTPPQEKVHVVDLNEQMMGFVDKYMEQFVELARVKSYSQPPTQFKEETVTEPTTEFTMPLTDRPKLVKKSKEEEEEDGNSSGEVFDMTDMFESMEEEPDDDEDEDEGSPMSLEEIASLNRQLSGGD